MNEKIVAKIEEINDQDKYAGFTESIKSVTEMLIISMFPGYFAENTSPENINENLNSSINKVLSYVIEDKIELEENFQEIIKRLPQIYESVISDIDAAYRGDPATKNYDEIILTYPCFRAISAYRFAHELYLMKIPLIPRAICEYEHRLTGIDIHPGATIGKNFFIDHGTGVVIGETTIIGDNVTIYQNVTLGAKSFPHDDEGSLIKGIKRHPNIGDNVVIYSGATILGNINIAANTVVKGNSWVTKSIE